MQKNSGALGKQWNDSKDFEGNQPQNPKNSSDQRTDPKKTVELPWRFCTGGCMHEYTHGRRAKARVKAGLGFMSMQQSETRLASQFLRPASLSIT
ncbi:hypothetical protein Y032_0043g855 [Ancylostoma ceylanicum]|uniref:Uncharacterized protein n=1 Tax=Ancylostoma ceylanicum TaxID=53326 RepID=A0A016UGE4_9BILA|nr:hypothetical protein Y032_0043g855 [Ancylostoma ceylanicum]